VPTYEYECDRCHRVFEVRQRISEPALTTHDGCGGSVHRLLSPAPFILKGGGWYVTDYPSEARKKALSAEKSSAGTTSSEKSDTKSDKPAASTAKSDGGGSTGTSDASAGASKPSD
jgi:putative FmdB family regulatory protein